MRGKRTLLFPALAFLFLFFPAPGWSQDSASVAVSAPQDTTRVLRIAEFRGAGILGGDAAALQSLITSYVVELKMFRVIDAGGQELALREAETAVQLGSEKEIAPLAADYILSARTEAIGSLYVFTIDVTKASTGEKKSVSDTFASENDVILSVRRLTRSLFEKQDAAAAGVKDRVAPQPTQNPAPSLSSLSGTWKGDKNIDRVTMLPDGRGFAVLASGARMSLKTTWDGARVVITQSQANSPDSSPMPSPVPWKVDDLSQPCAQSCTHEKRQPRNSMNLNNSLWEL